MTPPLFTPDDIEGPLRAASRGPLTLVGGQALNVWQRKYWPSHPYLKQMGPTASPDIDFVGSSAAAQDFASQIGAIVHKFADMDESVHVATLKANIGERIIGVDVIRNIAGVEDKYFRKHIVELKEEEKGYIIRVLDPMACMLSRLANINILKRRDEYSIGQAKISIELAKIYISELLESGRFKAAKDYLSDVEWMARLQHIGKSTHFDFGFVLDPVAVQAEFVEDARIDEMWRGYQLSKSIQRTYEKMESYEARRARHIERQRAASSKA